MVQIFSTQFSNYYCVLIVQFLASFGKGIVKINCKNEQLIIKTVIPVILLATIAPESCIYWLERLLLRQQ